MKYIKTSGLTNKSKKIRIMNTHVDFKIAKLLKDKEFDGKCSHYYIDDFQNFKRK